MKDMNRVLLIGRLGTDPVQRETKTGTTVVNFSLATKRVFRDREGLKTEHTDWHRVVTWGKEGERCAQFLKKGNAVSVEGSVRSRKYQAKDGSDRIAFEVHAYSVGFLGGGRMPVGEKVTDSSDSDLAEEEMITAATG